MSRKIPKKIGEFQTVLSIARKQQTKQQERLRRDKESFVPSSVWPAKFLQSLGAKKHLQGFVIPRKLTQKINMHKLTPKSGPMSEELCHVQRLKRSMSLNFGFGILDSGLRIWDFEFWEFRADKHSI